MKELNKKIILTDKQNSAISMIQINPICILSGLPGSGKTTVLKEILEWAHLEKMHVTQVAPTGKAAKRMVESTGYPSATIHSALKCSHDGEKFIFNHHEKNPLDTELLIIDEMSMVTNQLMADLMKAINLKRTRVLLVGDFNQLPAVGAGSVLQDLIDSKVIPHVYLDEIHRNSGKIVEACSSIQKGEFPDISDALNLDLDNPINLMHVESYAPSETLHDIKKIISERMLLRGYDPIFDVQVISPVNIRGELSCKSINEVLQEHLNPNGEKVGQFRLNDKIINTKNGPVLGTNKEQTAIVNGDMGRIVNFDKKNLVVTFFDPYREVLISRTDNNLLLAYAVTCHKMQGSEAPVIIIPIHTSFTYFTTKKWIYTAISRSKEICITVGQIAAMGIMIQNNRGHDRMTRLKEKLIKQHVYSEI